MHTPAIPQDTLPTTRTLFRAAAAMSVLVALLIVGVIMPAETDRDPIGLGRVLGLAEMGRIKVALAREAVADSTTGAVSIASQNVRIIDLRRGDALAPDAWRDSAVITLQPREGVEVKLAMSRGARSHFAWRTNGDAVYFDMHGEPPDAPKDQAPHHYARGNAVADSGSIVAAFDGVHGWFWRNRGTTPMTITLRTRGAYQQLEEIK